MTPKFRAWHKLEKRMFSVTTLSFAPLYGNPLVVGLWDQDNSWSTPIDSVELMQATGFEDCHSKPIFVGDIIEDLQNKVYTYGVIKLREKQKYPVLQLLDADAPLAPRCCNIWELPNYFADRESRQTVIGNIFENPGLIGEILDMGNDGEQYTPNYKYNKIQSEIEELEAEIEILRDKQMALHKAKKE